MLEWQEQFATGSVLVDTQHRMLIERINQLEQVISGPPPSKRTCDELLDFLGNYVATHFKFEEGYMDRMHCPAHHQNRLAHAAFLNMFATFKQRYRAEGPKPELLKSLQSAASSWIKSHILTVDIQLRGCLKNCDADGCASTGNGASSR